MASSTTLNLSADETDALCRLLDAYLGTETADPQEPELRSIAAKLGIDPPHVGGHRAE